MKAHHHLLIREAEQTTRNMGRVKESYALFTFVFVGFTRLQSLLANNKDKALLLLH